MKEATEAREAALWALQELKQTKANVYASLLAETVLKAHGGPLSTGQVVLLVQSVFPDASYNQVSGGLRTLRKHGKARSERGIAALGALMWYWRGSA